MEKFVQHFKLILIIVLVVGVATDASFLFLNYQKEVAGVKKSIQAQQENLLAQKAQLDNLKEK